jgi:hypothetical protein
VKRTILLAALTSLLILLPACQLFNTALNLAPAALLLIEAPDSEAPDRGESATAAIPPEETPAESSRSIPLESASLPWDR